MKISILAVTCLLPVAAAADKLRGTERKLQLPPLHYGNDGHSLDKCEGDCDDQFDCKGELICLKREKYNSDLPIYGCSGTPSSDDTDYCVSLDDYPSKTLLYLGNDGFKSKLGHCQGDCDSDKDCASGLKCFFREDNEPHVPGCGGRPKKYADYCVHANDWHDGHTPVPPVSPPTPSPVSTLPQPGYLQYFGKDPHFLLDKCWGDCDSDSDCGPGLKCFFREDNEPHVPGCTGSLVQYADYCVEEKYWHGSPTPSPVSTLPQPGYLKYFGKDPHFLLDKCWGDCDSDSDCGPGLKCFFREDNEPHVPGCTGSLVQYADYCVEEKY